MLPPSEPTAEPVAEPASAGATRRLALGLDAGGSRTRWALHGNGLQAEGESEAMSALQLDAAEGRAGLAARLRALAQALRPHGRVAALHAGVTGLGEESAALLAPLLGAAFGVPVDPRHLCSDIELMCRTAFAPGGGYVVYAGTGSIAAYLDGDGSLHRAGGRGGALDDGGSGYWIARQALRCVWRREDEVPGAWRDSSLAQALFERLGGSDWALTRRWMNRASRGEMGLLALAVADAARRGDADARALLAEAGVELARLAAALTRRYGPRPLVLAGRAWTLHEDIEAAFRAAAPRGVPVQRPALQPHHEAARIAASRVDP